MQLGGSALVDAATVVLAVLSAAALFCYRVNTTRLILAGAGFASCRSVLLA